MTKTSKQILLVAATTMEAKLLWQSLFPELPVAWNREEKFQYLTTPLSDDYVLLLIVTGIGTKRAYDGLKQALSIFQNVDSVIGCGLAGGLIKNSKRGDLVVPKTVQTRDDKWVPLLSLKNFLQVRSGHEIWDRLFTSENLISSPIEKAGIYAASGMEAVDMESAAWAKVCVESNINSWAIVRVVLDGGEETLPNMMNVVNELGEVVPHKAFFHFLFHPHHILPAMRLKPSKLKEVLHPSVSVIQAYLGSKSHEHGNNTQRPAIKSKVV
jgi:nucleoside phosphorylase